MFLSIQTLPHTPLACQALFCAAAALIDAWNELDLAYETGTFEESFKDGKGKPVKLMGKYVVVWKKQPTGQGKAIADIFNTNQ